MSHPAQARRPHKARRIPLLVEGAVVMMCVLCILIALTFANFRNLQDASRWNIHTYNVLEKIAIVRTSLGEEESRLRGFALTGENQFLADLPRLDADVLSALNALDDLTQDHTEQQNRLRDFRKDYTRWQQDFTPRLANPGAKLKKIGAETAQRRSRMERLRNSLNVAEVTERVLLTQRTQLQAASQRTAATFLLVASFCTVSFSAVFVALLGVQVRATEKFNRRLLSSQKQLQTVLETSPIILYAVDKNEQFTLMTGKGAASIGMDSEAVVGKKIVDVIGDSYDFQPVRAALAGGTNVSRSVIKGIVFETNRLPLYDEAGQISGMIGVGLDVTERVHAENALRDSENRFRSVIESLQEVVFQIDRQGCWRFLNPAWRITLGHDIASSLGKPMTDFVMADDQGLVEATFRTPGDGKVVHRVLARILTRSGSFRWMDVQIQTDWSKSGEFQGAAGTLSDVTDRKLAQEELLATTSLQKAILNSSNYSIIAVGPDGVIESFNRAAQELLGFTAVQVRGTKTPLLFHDPQEVAARAEDLSREMGREIEPGFEVLVAKARGGGIDEREWTYIGKDGKRVPMRLSVSELRGVEGEVSGFVIVGYDLTDTRRAESLKNEFVSVVSHELRTPLTSIRGALGLLAGGVAGQLPDGAQQMIDIASKNSDRLVLLINDILDIEKIESGEMRFVARELNLRELLKGAVEQNRAYGTPLGVAVEFNDESSLGEVHVHGDEDRLQQVFSNLISNACKFTPHGGEVCISAHVEGKMAHICVHDEGPGVPPEFVPRLFEKFAQADSSSTRKQGGTGLGLAIARAIVERQGGMLNYIPPAEGEQGSCFEFTLPIVEREPAWNPETEAKGQRVLICEDEPEIAELLALIVSNGGYEPEIATSLAQAREKLRQNSYVGMTLDLLFPDGDGLDLLEEIRADSQLLDLPVVVVSLKARAGVLRGEAFDVLDWMRKPIDAGRLLGALEKFHQSEIPRVLHVEDDADVRQVMAAILGESALVTPASTLREARARLQQAEAEKRPFDMAILDIGLPDGSGLDLVPQLSSANPQVPVIMFSASETTREEARLVAASLVKSRTSNEVLRETIHRLLRGHGNGETKKKSTV